MGKYTRCVSWKFFKPQVSGTQTHTETLGAGVLLRNVGSPISMWRGAMDS